MQIFIKYIKDFIIISSIILSSIFGYGKLNSDVKHNTKNITCIENKIDNMSKTLYRIEGYLINDR